MLLMARVEYPPPPPVPQNSKHKHPRVFRPRLSMTIIAIVMIVTTVLLGRWQVNRYSEATDLIEHYRQKHDELPPVDRLEAQPTADVPRGEHYHLRRAKISGQVDLDDVQLLTARYVLGKLGYRVLVPLNVEGSAHDKVLVDLGWVPTDRIDTYLPTLDGQSIVVEGRVQMPAENDETVQPQGEHLGRPTWMRPNPRAIGKLVDGLEPDLYVVAGTEAKGEQVDAEDIPIDGYTTPVRMAPSKHVEYAATWFAVAAVVLAAWIALSLRRKDAEDEGAADQTSKL